jgi:hypothetical protein
MDKLTGNQKAMLGALGVTALGAIFAAPAAVVGAIGYCGYVALQDNNGKEDNKHQSK